MEVKKALQQMKTGNATCPYDIPIEAWKCSGEVGGISLTRFFNSILVSDDKEDAG